jgi:CRISPR-associated protein Cas1
MAFSTNISRYLNLLPKGVRASAFFNYYEFYTGSFYPRERLISGKLLVKQVEHYTCSEKRIMIAQKLIDAASYNMHRNLRYYNERGKDVKQSMDDIMFLRKSIYETDKVESLMGIEGNIRKSYYSAWNIIINQELEFEKRIRNPPDNVINTMISFTNSLVYTRVLSEIYFTQLNPTISYLHQPGERRFSLSLDISEVFKPLLADRLIFSMLNKKQITKDSFTESLNYLHLEKEASQEIVSVFDSKLNTTIKHKELRRQVSYKQLIRLECYKLIKHLIGEKEYNGFKIWW